MFGDGNTLRQRSTSHVFRITIFSGYILCRILWGNLWLDIPVDGSLPPSPSLAEVNAALERLCRRHDKWLRDKLRKRYGAALADDLAQDTYLRAAPYEVAGSIRHPKAFLMEIADNLARDWFRNRRREIGQDEAARVIDEAAEDAQQEVETNLSRIVLALPSKLLDVFVLTHVQGLSYADVAKLRNIPVTTVHHRMREALALTRKALRETNAPS
ncbi:RNA polymerase sigma factor [Caulobacter sp. RHG1]|uniref:RNA polymerase sigma factor n=1 Tax=Caulobacter sp. (strain RHG1) TaxID=2545762 RepID=UPI001552658A|nr:RNA polymerase sigma factor [Caulobacter sp. RHG1]